MEKLQRVSPGDQRARVLAARHYSVKRPHGASWWSPAKTLCLINETGTILFVWQYPVAIYRRDGQTGYNCTLFRNEDSRQASGIILEAESIVIQEWGPNRAYTYVDPLQVKSTNPGYCFLMAGWKRLGVSKSGKVLLEKYLTRG